MPTRSQAPVSKRRRLAPEERQRLILAAAEEVFAERGFAGASMDEVARLAGITKPVIYDHFQTKAALFYATAESARDELLLRGRAARVEGDAESSFRAGIEAFFRFVRERPKAATVLFVTPRSDPIAAEAAAIIQAQARVSIAAAWAPLLRGRKAWEQEASVLFLQRGLHAMAEWCQANESVPDKAIVDALVDLIWHGLKPKA